MQTKLFDIKNADDPQIEVVANLLTNGAIVAVPTETVYGLAGNALDSGIVEKIFAAKGRPSDNPLILHIATLEQWVPLVTEIPELAKKLAHEFWPGALTIILPKSELVPTEVCGGLDTVAVRMPQNDVTRKIIELADVPLAAPSANTSGKPSPTKASHVMSDLNRKIDAVVDGGTCSIGVESTVISLAQDPPRFLRPGGITPEMLKEIVPDLVIDKAVFSKLEAGKKAASPGMKYKHYSPKAKVVILKGDFDKYITYVHNHVDENDVALCFDGEENSLNCKCLSYGRVGDPNSQASEIFDALRKLDDMGIDTAYARFPDADGIGLAVYNRLVRAAEFDVIEL